MTLKLSVICIESVLLTWPVLAAEPKAIGWRALQGDIQQVAGAIETGQTSTGLAGEEVRISGYLLPVDRDGDVVHEFMLVPWPGACSHMPQPPVNQMIHVLPAQPYRASQSYEPVTVTGKLKIDLEMTQLFIMDGVKVVESGYSIGLANVAPAPDLGANATSTGNPWRFLKK